MLDLIGFEGAFKLLAAFLDLLVSALSFTSHCLICQGFIISDMCL